MLKFFNKGFFTQYALIFFIGLTLWMPAILRHTIYYEPNGYWGLLNVAIFNIAKTSGVIGSVVAYLITFITGLLVNKFAANFKLSDRTSTLPLFLFIVLSSFSTNITGLSHFTIMLPFIVLLFLVVFKHDEKNENVFHSLDAGTIVGILALFYYPMVLMMLLIWIAFASIKGVSWRNFVATLLGLIFPLFMVYVYFFFSHNEPAFFDHIAKLSPPAINRSYFPFTIDSIITIAITLIILISAIKVMQQQTNLTVKQRSYFFIIGFYIFIISVIQLFISDKTITTLFFAPAGSITLNNILSEKIKNRWVNGFTVLFIMLILFNSLYHI